MGCSDALMKAKLSVDPAEFTYPASSLAAATPKQRKLLEPVLASGAAYQQVKSAVMRAELRRLLPLSLGVLRRDVLYQDLVDFAYHVGIEGGAEVFIGPGVVFSATLGWRRQVFRHGGNNQVEAVYVYFDSLTIKVGVGF